MKDNVTTDLKFIQGCIFGIVNDENNIIQWCYDNGEDSAITLHYYDIYKKHDLLTSYDIKKILPPVGLCCSYVSSYPEQKFNKKHYK